MAREVTSLAADRAVAVAEPARSETAFATGEDAARTSVTALAAVAAGCVAAAVTAVGVTAGLETEATGAEAAGVEETTGAGVETTGAGVETTAGVVGKAGVAAGVVVDVAGMPGSPACATSANAAAQAMTPPSTAVRVSTVRIAADLVVSIAADLAVSFSDFKRT